MNIRKLTDMHLGSTEWKLVLDSDMLFFRRPDALLAWIDAAFRPLDASNPSHRVFEPRICLMTDIQESYGYSRPLLEELCGATIPAKLNVGICGLRGGDIDWDQIEHWCRCLIEREGTCYYLEQALVAMLAARNGATIMPVEDYITFPTARQVDTVAGALQHYVSDSKPSYFGKAWKLATQLGADTIVQNNYLNGGL
jgi:hypothetical protein